MTETWFVCNQCGKSRMREDVVVVPEGDYHDVYDPAETHDCGFVAVRCREHPGAWQLAVRAVRAHLRRVRAASDLTV